MKNNLHIDFKFDEDKFLKDLYEKLKHCMENFIHNKIGCYVEFLPDNGMTTEVKLNTSGLEKELAKFHTADEGCIYCKNIDEKHDGNVKYEPETDSYSYIERSYGNKRSLRTEYRDESLASVNITHCPWCGRDLTKGLD